MDLIIPELPYNPTQKLLLQTMTSFFNLEKLDLKTHDFRIHLGQSSAMDTAVVLRELAHHNLNFWPISTDDRTADRMNLPRYLTPRTPSEVFKKVSGGIVCLVAPTERFSDVFVRSLHSYEPKYVLHFGG